MSLWVYLKSDNPADALALASLISQTNDHYNIVRRSVYSSFFEGLSNVHIDYYSKMEDEDLVVINEIESDSWRIKCDIIAKELSVNNYNYKPYIGFIRIVRGIETLLEVGKFVCLYLFPHSDQKLDLMVVDQLIRIFEIKGVKAISCGTNVMPCIKKTKDFRQLIDLPILCGFRDRFSFILTSENSLKTIGEALNINVYVISDSEGLTLNGISMDDASQMANYIMMNNK